MNYVAFEDIQDLHREIIEKESGLKGEINPSLLEGALFQIQNDDYYPLFEDKLAHMVFSCVKFHPFADGNKRTSLLAGGLFIEINQKHFNLKKWFIEMEDVVVKLANNEIDKEELKTIIQKIIYP